MDKRRLIGFLACCFLLFIQVKAYSDDDYYTQSLQIGDDTKTEDATNVQTYTKSKIHSKTVNGTVNNTVYVPAGTPYVPYNNYYQYPTNYYAYPTTTYIYRTGIPYYSYGTPSYMISQPAINELGYTGTGAGMALNYQGHNFSYNIGAGRGMYASRTIPYNPPPPPSPPPCCNPQHSGQIHPINLPSNVIYKR